MFLRFKKSGVLLMAFMVFLGAMMLKVTDSNEICYHLNAQVLSDSGVKFAYSVDVLSNGKLFLETELSANDQHYQYFRLFEYTHIKSNTFIIHEISQRSDENRDIEPFLKFDFFKSLQEVELFKPSAEVVLARSESRYLYLHSSQAL